MRLFAIGDLHLSMSGDKPMDVFGEHWKDHHMLLERNWRRDVCDDDTVLLPGDLSWAMDLEEAREDLEWLGRLPGRKVVIKGNHDLWWASLSKLRSALPKGIIPLQHTALRTGPAVITGVRGWITPLWDEFDEERDGKVYRRELLRLEMALEAAGGLMDRRRKLVVMMHYPPIVGGAPTEFADMMSDRGVDVCVYGHIHCAPGCWPERLDTESGGVLYRLVSADRLDFTPLELAV
ncbi:MAG: metallophosphoesterase [Candidatus Fermentibacteraceae bacterium]|nr:metallophosphoesterase [Candidatus Fermentibacteraceae bacterium]MBN2608842.1 metallophosphoesterase [Candidatus Fermentibacteraceae bacterium]